MDAVVDTQQAKVRELIGNVEKLAVVLESANQAEMSRLCDSAEALYRKRDRRDFVPADAESAVEQLRNINGPISESLQIVAASCASFLSAKSPKGVVREGYLQYEDGTVARVAAKFVTLDKLYGSLRLSSIASFIEIAREACDQAKKLDQRRA